MYPIVYVLQKIENGWVVKYKDMVREGIIERLQFFSSLEGAYEFLVKQDGKTQTTVDDLMSGNRITIPQMELAPR